MMDDVAAHPDQTYGDVGKSADVRQSVVAWRPPEPPFRIHYFDWLRAIAVLGIVVYHSFLPFAGPWLISNAETSDLLHAAALLFETFGLALLFLISGAGTRFSLQRRSMRTFLVERAKRLLLPFAVGSIVLVPPIYYIIGLYNGTVTLSFPEFLVAYPVIAWTYCSTQVGLSPQILIWIGMHLWFLAWLFFCSALALPIFAFFRSSIGRSWLDALARLNRWPGSTLLWSVPITLPRLGLAGLSSAENAWGSDVLASYAVLFLVGYIIYSDDRFVAAIRRDLGLSLIAAVVGSIALLVAGYPQWAAVPKTLTAMDLYLMSLVGFTGWAWTSAMLGWGIRTGFMQRRLPAGIAEAALPIYILHYPILFGITALVIQWPLGLVTKVLINEVLVVGVTLLVTAACLRIQVVRPLLGLRSLTPTMDDHRLLHALPKPN